MLRPFIVILPLLVLSLFAASQAGASGTGPDAAREVKSETAGVTVKQIASSGQFAMALLSDGHVEAWGLNDYGQLGQGFISSSPRTTPVRVKSATGAGALANVKSIAVGWTTAYAVMSNGTVRVWGQNGYSGMHGNGDVGDSETGSTLPVTINGLTNVKEIDATYGTAIALHKDGTVSIWGDDSWGQLGDGEGVTPATGLPVKITSLTGIKDVDGSFGFIGRPFFLAVRGDAKVVSWGDGFYNTLGNGRSSSFIPRLVNNLANVTAVSAGEYHAMALLADRTVKAWADDTYGQLGNSVDTYDHAPTPVKVKNLTGVKAISAGTIFSLALLTNGEAKAWGSDYSGELGNSVENECCTDKFPLPVDVKDLTGITSIVAANGTSFASLGSSARSWGSDGFGKLGNGSPIEDKPVPVRIKSLP
ncbi:MAG: hypothetical protein WEB00_07695 [Dehalococcoidia bacterium]